MGFFSCKAIILERIYDEGPRKLRASHFDVVLNKWHSKDFKFEEVDAAVAYLVKELKAVDM